MTAAVGEAPHPAVTGIGSLPHLSIDAALEYALRFDIPFLPQLPILNPRERMIHQAVAGFPGVRPPGGPEDAETGAVLDITAHARDAMEVRAKLEDAFRNADRKNAFEEFLPRQEDYRALRPWIWELSERGASCAKLQLAGPITTLRNIRTADGGPLPVECEALILRFVLARALALCRLTLEAVPRVYFAFDEPWLFALQPDTRPRDLLALKDLGAVIQAVKKTLGSETLHVGIHCCSDPDWSKVLDAVQPDFLSVDASVSLHSLTGKHRAALRTLQDRKAQLFWGIIPSNTAQDTIELPGDLCTEAVLTPACGLAYHSPLECEEVLARLTQEVRRRTRG